MIINAVSVVANRRSARSSSRRSRAISACSADGFAHPLTRLLTGQHAGVAELAPLGDLGGEQALRPQIGTALVGLARRLVGRDMLHLLRRGERAPQRPIRPRPSRIGYC